MAGGLDRKTSSAAASAQDHTGFFKILVSVLLVGILAWSYQVIQSPPSKICCSPYGIYIPEFFKILLSVFFVGILALGYQVIQPPPSKLCGSPNAPPVTAPRIKLRDGRHLAYKEIGVSRDVAKFKIVYIHGFNSCRHHVIISNLSSETIEELGVYIVSFDRPGYGESDPHPEQTMKSLAMDVEELADQLGLGSKFYVIGMSMGGQLTWSCLKYIPHRLAGAALVAPVSNYWWPGFPANLSKEAFYKQHSADQWALRIAHYAPWLAYWWNTQKFFPASSVIAGNPDTLSSQDKELMARITKSDFKEIPRQQGEFESVIRCLMVGFGNWEFDPMDLENPFPNNEGSVHLWHGDEDGLVPVTLQRYIAQKLPWIQYHELPGSGHFFPFLDGMAETIVRLVLTGGN